MKDKTYNKYRKAKDDLLEMQKVYSKNRENEEIKFEYGKLCLKSVDKRETGKRILASMYNTSYAAGAKFELGVYEYEECDFIKAKFYFKNLINTKYHDEALIYLAKLALIDNDIEKANNYYSGIRDPKIYNYKYLDIGKYELSKGNKEIAKICFEKCLEHGESNYAHLELLFLEINNNNYEKAMIILNRIMKGECGNVKRLADKIFIYLGSRLNVIPTTGYDLINEPYVTQQLFDYNEEDAINHVANHTIENNTKIVHGLFNSNIDIKKLFYEIRDFISNINPDRTTLFDYYIIPCEVGVNNEEYLKVITLPNTSSIISMYPVSLDKTKKLFFNVK